MSIAQLAANVLDNKRLVEIPEETEQRVQTFEVWQHGAGGWLFLIDYSAKEHAEDHVARLRQGEYNQRRGETFHVVECEAKISTSRKRLNP